jgi:D-alanyl-D-alanine carboxypeptidase
VKPGEAEEESAEEENAASDSVTSNQPPPSDSSGSQNQTPLLVVSSGDYLLALVIKDTTLKSDYVPANLVAVPAYMHPSYNMQLRKEALEHLESLWQAAKADGVTLHIRSAYRSYNTQKGLFNDYASRYGEEQANRFSARPGQSEHQLGTAVDFGGTSVDFKADYGQTPQGLWLAANAYKYGFAMSYAEGKEHITGYIYEPWHYRYIGVDAAAEWKASGKTLKEFLEGKPQYYE